VEGVVLAEAALESRIMKSLIALGVTVLTAGIVAAPASAAIDTTTTGVVCCPHFAGQLENYGGYTFRGKTTPALTGQYVKFQYKRPWSTRWRGFKPGLSGSDGTGFYVLNRNAPRDHINSRDRWNVLFSPGVRQGYWKIRAVFPWQGGYARSQVVKKYWVRQSD
jgi:hypothetical protein